MASSAMLWVWEYASGFSAPLLVHAAVKCEANTAIVSLPPTHLDCAGCFLQGPPGSMEPTTVG